MKKRYGILGMFLLLLIGGLYIQTSYAHQRAISMHKPKDFVEAVYKEQTPAPIEKIKKESTINQLALGDSIVAGYGTTGKEYHFVNIVSEKIGNLTGKTSKVDNEGINGMTSKQLADYVQTETIKSKIRQANLITVNIGGNDILKTFKEEGGKETMEEFDTIRNDYEENIDAILTTIRQENTEATIVLMELYTPRYMEKQYKLFSRLFLPDWNAVLEEAKPSYEPVVLVETDRFTDEKDASVWYKDGIHLNDDGQQDIANGIVKTLTEIPE